MPWVHAHVIGRRFVLTKGRARDDALRPFVMTGRDKVMSHTHSLTLGGTTAGCTMAGIEDLLESSNAVNVGDRDTPRESLTATDIPSTTKSNVPTIWVQIFFTQHRTGNGCSGSSRPHKCSRSNLLSKRLRLVGSWPARRTS